MYNWLEAVSAVLIGSLFAFIMRKGKRLFNKQGTDILSSPYHQFNFYDQDDEMSIAIDEASRWYEMHLTK